MGMQMDRASGGVLLCRDRQVGGARYTVDVPRRCAFAGRADEYDFNVRASIDFDPEDARHQTKLQDVREQRLRGCLLLPHGVHRIACKGLRTT
jgi:hypothetical protein